jgi:hypothetical protein
MRRGTSAKLSQKRSTIDRQQAIDPIREAEPARRPARGIHHADERGLRRQVLQPRNGRLRAELGSGFGQPTNCHLERRIIAQRVAVIGIRVPGGDQQAAEADHLDEAVPHPLGCSRIGDAAGQPLGNPELALDLRQHQHAGIRGQPTTIEGDVNRLTGDR